MLSMLLGALLFAMDGDYAVRNPRFVSPNGEMSVVVRVYPVGDFESISEDEYYRRLDDAAFNEPPPGEPRPPVPPMSAALYRIWPGGNPQQLAEFTCRETEECKQRVLVADDGHIVTYNPVRCDQADELLTIRARDGSVVRTLLVRDVLTPNDQQWLCRGLESDVRFALQGDALRVTMLLTDGRWDDAEARYHSVGVDLGSGSVAALDRDLCPAPWHIVAEADDRLPLLRTAPDVQVLASQTLLNRAITPVLPEYPRVATLARISGTVGVQVVVGTDGRVESARIVKPLPFGLDAAVQTAMKEWQFARSASRVSGMIAFRFELVRGPRVGR